MAAPHVPAADDPAALAAIAADAGRPLLVGLDVDGVLAPIVAHAADAALLPGMLEAVAELAAPDAGGRRVRAGRSRTSAGSGSPSTSRSSGSTGWSGGPSGRSSWPTTRRRGCSGCWRWRPTPPTGPATGRGSRSSRRASCSTCARPIPTTAPARPTSCSARPRTSPAPTSCRATASSSCSTRATSKAMAVAELRAELAVAAVVFVGDDRTDEEVFAALGAGDCSIRVGPGATAARHRLAGPPEVLAFLRALDHPPLTHPSVGRIGVRDVRSPPSDTRMAPTLGSTTLGPSDRAGAAYAPAMELVRTFCRICEPSCGLVAHVDGGTLVKLTPDREHPVTKGFACHKGLAGVDVNHDPDRLDHPHAAGGRRVVDDGRLGRRRSPTPPARLRSISAEHGPDAISAYIGNPTAFNALASLHIGAAAAGARRAADVLVGHPGLRQQVRRQRGRVRLVDRAPDPRPRAHRPVPHHRREPAGVAGELLLDPQRAR